MAPTEDAPTGLGVVAVLLGPAGAPPPGIADPGPSWGLDRRRPSAGSWVWARLPSSGSDGAARAVVGAVRRELALLRLRGRLRGGVSHLQRLPAPAPAMARAPARWVRPVLLGGALVAVDAARRPMVLDDLLGTVGASRTGVLRVGIGGSVVVPVVAGPTPAMLRVALAGDRSIERNDLAIRGLEAPGRPWLPRSLGCGEHAGLSWSLETRVPGTRPRALHPDLVDDVVGAVAALGPAGGQPTAPGEDLAAVADAVPSLGRDLDVLRRRVTAALVDLPGAPRHGDLWSGNLLVDGGRLSGIVDWDAHHEASAPGTDLLQLLGTEERTRRREALGTYVRERPWRRLAEAQPWRVLVDRFDLRPDRDQLDAIGLAWWAAEVAGTLRRVPQRASDEAWIDANVRAVLASFGR